MSDSTFPNDFSLSTPWDFCLPFKTHLDAEDRFNYIRFHLQRAERDVNLEILGLSPDDVVGKTLFDLFSHEEAEAYQEHHDKVFESGVPITYEHELEYGGKRWILQAIKKYPNY